MSKPLYVICVAVLMFQLLALLLPWSYHHDKKSVVPGFDNDNAYLSLWNMCGQLNKGPVEIDVCIDDLSKVPHLDEDAIKICRVFAILGVCLTLLAVLAMMFYGSNIYTLGLMVASGLCSMISMAVWANKFLGKKKNPAPGWTLSLLSFVFLMMAVVIHISKMGGFRKAVVKQAYTQPPSFPKQVKTS